MWTISRAYVNSGVFLNRVLKQRDNEKKQKKRKEKKQQGPAANDASYCIEGQWQDWADEA